MLQDYTLNRNTPIPLYYQLKAIIDQEIQNGSYRPGDMIPTEIELINMFQVSRSTVRQAIQELAREGKLYSVKSKGTFVSKEKLNQDFINHLESFNEQIRRLGKTPSTEVLKLEVVKAASSVAKALSLKEGDSVVLLKRRRFADNVPIVVLDTFLPDKFCHFVLTHDFQTESLYHILETHSSALKVHHVRRIAEAVNASKPVAQQLGINPRDAVLFFTTIGYSESGTPLEYSLSSYRGDSNRFEVTVMA